MNIIFQNKSTPIPLNLKIIKTLSQNYTQICTLFFNIPEALKLHKVKNDILIMGVILNQ